MSGPKETPPTGLTQKQLTYEVFKLLNKQDEARIEAAAAQAARDEAQAARDDAMLTALTRIAAILPPVSASPESPPSPNTDGAERTASDERVEGTPSTPTPLDPPLTHATPSRETAPSGIPHWKALPIPAALEPDVSLRAYEDWRTAWDEYSISADIHLMPLAKQTVHLRRCLSSDLKSILTHSLGAPLDAGLTIEQTLQIIDQHMRGQRNVAVRQQEFNLYRQQQDQTFDAFFARLKQLAKDADLCQVCLNTRLATAIITGLRDRHLAERLQSHEPALNLDEVIVKCRAHESAKKSNAEFKAQPANLHKISAYKSAKKPQPTANPSAPPPASKFKIPDELRRKFSCMRCGNLNKHVNRKCPAADKQCKECSKTGHFNYMCLRKLLNKSDSKPNKDMGIITINNVEQDEKCPTIKAHVTCLTPKSMPKNRHCDLTFTPDSGSQMTAIGLDHFEKLGLNVSHLLQATPVNIRAANGSPLDSLGVFPGKIKLKRRSINTNIEVLFDFPTAVLSWKDAKALGILPHHYPEPCSDSASCCAIASDVTPPRPVIPPPTPSPPGTLPGGTPTSPAKETKRKPPPHLSPAEARDFFIKEFPEVLRSRDDFKKGEYFPPMKNASMSIHLKPDAKPFAIYAPRNIAYALRDKTKKELDSLVAQGIITPVTDDVTPWVHPMVAVLRKDKDVRICVDLSHLNSQVQRCSHPFVTSQDVLRRIPPGTKYLTKMDAIAGYHQIPLDEAAQSLTCFITPWGKYKFLRSPMGFIGSGDAFCRYGDRVIEGVDNCGKVVDDLLAWDRDYVEHIDRIFDILCRCSDSNTTMSREKFIFAASETEYCGNIVSEDGIRADPQKVKAIQEFPVPKNITDLRSFFGLVAQLQDFSYEISDAAEALRPLLSTKNAFIWTTAHQDSFDKVKKALTSTPTLAHYDMTLPTALQSDASRLNGLGYALLQQHGERWRLVQCGSRFLSDVEGRYATGEQELLAAWWAVRKCRNYLLGLPHFELILDHKPLIPILNVQTLDQVENPRLQRMKEKLMGYSFTAVWRKGSNHNIPDALSRAPVDQPDEEDREFEEELSMYVRTMIHAISSDITELNDPILDDLRSAAVADVTYQHLIEKVTSGFPNSKSHLDNELLPYWKVRHDLSHENGLALYKGRILVPPSKRREVLQHLHSSHRGTESSKRRASQTVWWPGIANDIVTTTEACTACQQLQPSQQKEPIMRDTAPTRPFESVSADLFSHAGKSYLVYADRYTGWCEVHAFSGDTSARPTIRAFRKFFGQLGVPMRLRTDGGPPFSSHRFRDFLVTWKVKHDLSTPHFPRSNGHAEASVKAMKHLIIKCKPQGNLLEDDEFTKGVIELRNTPRIDGLSPAKILLGRPLRSLVPTIPSAFDPKWHDVAQRLDRRTKAQVKADKRYNEHAKSLPPIALGSHVALQHHATKRWDTTGTVVGVGKRRDYLVKTPSGAVYWRNRVLLRPIPPPTPAAADASPPAAPPPAALASHGTPSHDLEDPSSPRRSARAIKKPLRFSD